MKNKKTYVTQTFLPSQKKYIKYIENIWKSGHLTNNGEYLQELELKLKNHLNVPYLSIVNNGTIALQISIEALGLKNEIITTPFSYIATSSSILWQKCTPVFVDICSNTLNINAENIEQAITNKTSGILATHVFGNPCNVKKINQISKKYNLKVIYDAAHAFGVKVNNTPIVNYGDISILSFHATKLFHTIEGGALITKELSIYKKNQYMRNFGHQGEESFQGIGINGKMSEFHAAMGLCVLDDIDKIFKKRKKLFLLYNQLLSEVDFINKQIIPSNISYNYSYYPIIFNERKKIEVVKKELNNHNIYPRRYFYPSLNTLDFTDKKECPIAEDISKRILCLPLSHYLSEENLKKITQIIKNV